MAAPRLVLLRQPAALPRAAGFMVLWLALAGWKPGDVPAMAVAAAAATWCSLILLPPRARRISPVALARLALGFPVQSVIAGIDVALRALHPGRPRLRPGFAAYTPALPPGEARDAFLAYASLLPGTLPTDITPDGGVLIHCLDTAQPAAAQMAREEALFARALGRS
ncbi:MAG: Na+/H+ antiporter subunit E [Proteobacteria bacterium]|nr:Na+/H+ antiporter subunit E [Pseudomonadota bacterium]